MMTRIIVEITDLRTAGLCSITCCTKSLGPDGPTEKKVRDTLAPKIEALLLELQNTELAPKEGEALSTIHTPYKPEEFEGE